MILSDDWQDILTSSGRISLIIYVNVAKCIKLMIRVPFGRECSSRSAGENRLYDLGVGTELV